MFIENRNVSFFLKGMITTRDPHHTRNQCIVMILTQVVVTAVLTLQWVIGQLYLLSRKHQIKTINEGYTVILIVSFTSTFYSLNNVKSFYFSMLTSKLHRQAFRNGCQRLFSRLYNFHL